MDRLAKNLPDSPSTVIPVSSYPDVRQAVKWLEDVFGFRERLQIADHRAQLVIGDGAMIVAEYTDLRVARRSARTTSATRSMVRISDVTAHFEHARACGAEILQPPVDYVYG